MTLLGFGLRVLLAAVCLVAAGSKLRPRAFAALTLTFEQIGLPRSVVRPAGLATITVEAAVVPLALWAPTALAGAVLATVLFAAFTAGVGRAVRQGVAARCACFGAGGSQLGRSHVNRNAALTIVAAGGCATTAVASATTPQPAGAGIAAFAGMTAGLLFIFWDDLSGLVTAAKPLADATGRGKS